MARTRRPVPPPPPTGWAGLLQRADPLTWILLPLRLFLGFVFCYAGISKIADRRFLDSSSVFSIHSQIVAVRPASPVRDLLGPVVDHSFAFGVFTALAEVAVGIGVLVGLLTRIAAAGGMLLALSLWFTISWQAQPWYTSADVVYLFAFTPLLIGGAGAWSADAWLADMARRDRSRADGQARRTFVVAGAAVVAGAVLGTASLFRRSAPGPQAVKTPLGPTSAAPPGTSPAPGTASNPAGATSSAQGPANALIATSAVPVGGAKQIFPGNGLPVWVLQLEPGRFTAVSGTCPHQGCPVSFISPGSGFVCPCHGSTFAADGSLLNGPATSGLQQVPVKAVDGEVVPS